MNAIPEPIAITHYSPKRGDVLIVTLPCLLEDGEADSIRETIHRECGRDVGLLLLEPGVSISILRRDEKSAHSVTSTSSLGGQSLSVSSHGA